MIQGNDLKEDVLFCDLWLSLENGVKNKNLREVIRTAKHVGKVYIIYRRLRGRWLTGV